MSMELWQCGECCKRAYCSVARTATLCDSNAVITKMKEGDVGGGHRLRHHHRDHQYHQNHSVSSANAVQSDALPLEGTHDVPGSDVNAAHVIDVDQSVTDDVIQKTLKDVAGLPVILSNNNSE